MFQSVKELVEEYFELTGRPVSTMTIDEYAKIKEMALSMDNSVSPYRELGMCTNEPNNKQKGPSGILEKQIPIAELTPEAHSAKNTVITEFKREIKEDKSTTEVEEKEKGGMLAMLCSIGG